MKSLEDTTFFCLHRQAVPVIDWKAILQSRPPEAPPATTFNSERWRHRIRHYQPTPFCRALGLDRLRRMVLWNKYHQAKEKDARLTQMHYAAWSGDYQDWQKRLLIATALAGNEPGARLAALNQQALYGELYELGVRFHVQDIRGCPEVEVFAHSDCVLSTLLITHPHDSQKWRHLYLNSVCLSVISLCLNTWSMDKAITLTVYEGGDRDSRRVVHTRCRQGERPTPPLLGSPLSVPCPLHGAQAE